MNATIRGTCKQDGCAAGVSGVCIENLKLDECPHFVVADPVPEEFSADSESARTMAGEVVQIGRGASLSLAEADALLRSRSASVVAFVGGPSVGKTTLVSTIYELARRRRMVNFGFAGSDTIRGFEERCHLSRTASGRAVPDTKRTSRRNPLSFLHLRLVRASGNAISEFVISDRTGEDFDDVLDEPTRCKSMPELARANRLVFLMDGSLLSAVEARNAHISRARMLFMALLQCGLIDSDRPVQIVLTKLDIIQATAHAAATLARFDDFVAELRTRSGEKSSVQGHKVAARFSGDLGTVGSGIEDMMQGWVALPTSRSFVTRFRVPAQLSTPRADLMIRFGDRDFT